MPDVLMERDGRRAEVNDGPSVAVMEAAGWLRAGHSAPVAPVAAPAAPEVPAATAATPEAPQAKAPPRPVGRPRK